MELTLPLPSAERRLIWVVDDETRDAERARRTLEAEYHVEVLLDGADVLERLATHPPPDLLVLDWLMPGMSGLDVCRFLRSTESPPVFPILLVTVRSQPEQVVEGLDAGADEVLGKPYLPIELIARTRALLRSQRLRERAEAAEASVRRLLETGPDPLLAVDAQGRLIFVNGELARVLGRSEQDLLGSMLGDVVPQLAVRSITLGGGESLFPLPDVQIRGRTYAPYVRVLPTDDAARTTIALRDVTEQRTAEAKRLDFYSIIAHDVRSPLAALTLRLEYLLGGHRGLLTSDVQSDLRKMRSSLSSLISMINDFLELARLEGVGYKIARERVDVAEVVEQTVSDFEPLVGAQDLRLDLSLPDMQPIAVADSARLKQVVTNLLSNAIKFTPAGGRIAVAVSAGVSHVEVRVADSGPGIEPHRLPHLFERYVTSKSEPGTGLGLMIVREIIEAHGGRVGVDSEPGRGSTFWFRIPGRAVRPHQDVSARP